MDVLTGSRRDRHRHPRRRARRPVRGVPQLLRQPRLRDPAADRARAGARASCALRHVRFADATSRGQGHRPTSPRPARGDGERVDALDGTAFTPDEIYLTLAHFTDERRRPPATTPASRSTTARSSERETDALTMNDYLWRWDTDWFWCSGAFGAQNPWSAASGRAATAAATSTTGIVGLDAQLGLSRPARPDQGSPRPRAGHPGRRGAARARCRSSWRGSTPRSACVRSGCARCAPPAPGRPTRCEPGETYVNVGFWGTVEVPAGSAPGHGQPPHRGSGCTRSAATSRSTPRRSTTEETFDQMYGGEVLTAVRDRYDPDGPTQHPVRESGEELMTHRRRSPPDDRRGARAADEGRHAVPVRGLRRQRRRARRTPRSRSACSTSAACPTS